MGDLTLAKDNSISNRDGRLFILTALSLGHAAVHWFQQLWPVIIPSVKSSLALSNVQMGVLTSVKQFATGPITTLPSGLLSDKFRRNIHHILAVAFIAFGVAHVFVALSPTFLWMVPSVALLGIGTALWHPASMGTLSRRFPEKRGSALAAHGVGASIGDTVAPLAIGFCLLTIRWQTLLELHLMPAIIISLILWKFLASTYTSESQSKTKLQLSAYWSDIKSLITHPVVVAIIAVNIFTNMARLSVTTFLPIYIQETLGYSALGVGFFWGLLHAMGAISQPIMGYLSDKFGRKSVLLPALIVHGILYLGMAWADTLLELIIVIGLQGLFFYALVNVTSAAIMDVASDRIQSSTMGITGVFNQLSLPAPIFAGFLVTRYEVGSAFMLSGILTLIAAGVIGVAKIPKLEGSNN